MTTNFESYKLCRYLRLIQCLNYDNQQILTVCPELRCKIRVFTLAGNKFKSEINSLSKKALYLKIM